MASLASGTRVGPYEVAALIGAGGMGEVYRAHDARLGRDVALKVLRAGTTTDEDFLRRFEQEARLAASIAHPNIVAVHDVGTHAGTPFLVTELLDGESLRALLGRGALPARRALEIAAALAEGLAAAHAKGIIHRDLKPENVFITRDGRAKILDFGIAKATQSDIVQGETLPQTPPGPRPTAAGSILGTVGYMAPEQVRGKPADQRSDIFALGAVLYEMLAGKRAFDGDNPMDIGVAVLKNDPPDLPASVPANVERVVRRCLEKDPDRRYQSARDLAFHLEALRDGATTRTGAAEAATTAPTPVPRGFRRGALIAAGIVAAILATNALVFLLARRAPPRPPAPAAIAEEVAAPGGTAAAAPEPPRFTAVTQRRGFVRDARFNEPRNTVLYDARWDDAPSRIFEVGLDGLGTRALTDRDVLLMDVSPRGEIAVRRRASEGTPTTIGIMTAEGAIRDVIEKGFAAAWAPEGLAVFTVDEKLMEIELRYPEDRKIYSSAIAGLMLAASPSGELAILERVPGTAKIRLLGIKAGTSPRLLAEIEAAPTGAAWHPNGELWWSQGTSIHAARPDGEQRLVYAAPSGLTLFDLHRDGRALVATDDTRGAIVLSGPDGERDVSLGRGQHVTAISPDGKVLVLVDATEQMLPRIAIWRLDEPAPVDLGQGFPGALSPDGKRIIAFTQQGSRLSLVPTGAGRAVDLPRGAVAVYVDGFIPCFTPDGQRVVFAGSAAERPFRMWVQDVAGGDPRPITPEGTLAFPVADDQHVYVDKDGALLAYPLDGDGSAEPRKIGSLQRGEQPLRVSADGKALYIFAGVGDDVAKIHKVDLKTGQRKLYRELRPRFQPGFIYFSNVLFSTDEKHMVMSYLRRQSDLFVVQGLE